MLNRLRWNPFHFTGQVFFCPLWGWIKTLILLYFYPVKIISVKTVWLNCKNHFVRSCIECLILTLGLCPHFVTNDPFTLAHFVLYKFRSFIFSCSSRDSKGSQRWGCENFIQTDDFLKIKSHVYNLITLRETIIFSLPVKSLVIYNDFRLSFTSQLSFNIILDMSGTRRRSLHISVINASELFLVKWLILCYVNCNSIQKKLLHCTLIMVSASPTFTFKRKTQSIWPVFQCTALK